MSETSFPNLIFFALAIAVFIGRTLVAAKKRKTEPPPPPPKVPALHFEQDDDDIPGYLKTPRPAAKAAKTAPKKQPAAVKPAPAKDTPPADKIAPVKGTLPPGSLAAGQADFTLNLAHLSPMKQAVVMAEILGPPKGMG